MAVHGGQEMTGKRPTDIELWEYWIENGDKETADFFRRRHNRNIMKKHTELLIPDTEYQPDPVRDVPFTVDKITGGLRRTYPPGTGRDHAERRS